MEDRDNQPGVNTISYDKLVANQLGLEDLKTKNGKQIQVIKDHRGRFLIEFATGGQKPKEFAGLFTHLKAVGDAVMQYLNKKEDVKADAKTESSKTTD